MKYIIRQPQSFSEIGRKDNQEDFLWPNPLTVTADQRIFIMCDGVGGQENGEVASSTAATALGTYLTDHWPTDGIVTRPLFEEALAYAYDELDKADSGESVRKMATTMTCVVLHHGGALVAHIGDSRIYHLRPSISATAQGRPIIYESLDHSLVNDLLRVGELTEEEARDYPHKNIITRAMQPGGERRSRADIFNIDDVKAGDYFFLCSDGVLEQVTNEILSQIVCSEDSDADKIAAIQAVCDGRTRDNNTCWLVPIDSVILEPGDEERVSNVVMACVDDGPAPAAKNAKDIVLPAATPAGGEAPAAGEADAAQDETDEMSRKYEKKMADIQKRQNNHNGTIIVILLVIAAIASIILYNRFTDTESPLKGLAPNIENATPDETEGSLEDGNDVEDFMDEAAEEQATETSTQTDDKAKAEEPLKAETQENAAEQKEESGAKHVMDEVLSRRKENAVEPKTPQEPATKPAEAEPKPAKTE